MTRPTEHSVFMEIAYAVSKRATCCRRKVGCVLVDADGRILSTGYNGPPRGAIHCTDVPCAGATSPTGVDIDLCEAVHAEQNSVASCPDTRQIAIAYITTIACVSCTKLLLNTSCHTIIYGESYVKSGKELWEKYGKKCISVHDL